MSNYDLNQLNSTPISQNNYNVNSFDPTDVFEFDITGNRQIGLYLHDLNGGDADLGLYRDSNGNGVLDSNDTLVSYSVNVGTSSETIDYTASAGTYFAQVAQFSGSPISYDLDLAATYDIGTVGASPVSLDNYTVGTFDPTDTFEFDITGNRQIGLSLHGMNGGDADLRLYSDSNNNGVFDASDVQVASSTNSGTGPDTIDYAASAGTYFAQVTQFSGSPISYDLDLAATYDIGTVGASPVSLDNYTVSTFDPTDTFEFDITGNRQIGLSLHGMNGGDADLHLYSDSNNNGVFDASDVQVASSTNSGTGSETIDYAASAGTYFAQVTQFSGSPISYDLDFSTNYNIGTVGASPVSLDNYSVGTFDPTDTFEFDITGNRQIGLSLHGMNGGDADLHLYSDSNNNG
ncbi:hypothetical protein VB741_10100, partial [Leptothoe sp. PORK10 BA2]